jgi:hypothetical protein
VSKDQSRTPPSRLKTIWDLAFVLSLSSWGRLQAALVLLVLILAGSAWQAFIGPVSYFFLLLIALLLGALLIGVIVRAMRNQTRT